VSVSRCGGLIHGWPFIRGGGGGGHSRRFTVYRKHLPESLLYD
jgi:hypothetical protein